MVREGKLPDIRGPRFRPIRYNVLNADMIKRFQDKYPQYKDVPKEKLREIIHTINELMWKSVITNRAGIDLPESLGSIFIGTCEPAKKFNVNFDVLIKDGKKFRHRNFPSDNYLAKIFYTNYASKYRFHNREVWGFRGIRQFKRAVAHNYPHNWMNYIKVDNLTIISEIYRKSVKTLSIKSAVYELPENYNEFDLN